VPNIDDYLDRPYARILIPAEEGGYSAEILEFPGCFAEGDTAEEALSRLEQAAASWLDAALDQGQPIPEPFTNQGYSGRIVLRIPRSIHRQSARFAHRDDTSLNQFFLSAISARMGAEDLVEKMLDRIEDRIIPVARTVLIMPDTAFQFWHDSILQLNEPKAVLEDYRIASTRNLGRMEIAQNA
jgi:antitoxin HicB